MFSCCPAWCAPCSVAMAAASAVVWFTKSFCELVMGVTLACSVKLRLVFSSFKYTAMSCGRSFIVSHVKLLKASASMWWIIEKTPVFAHFAQGM